MKKPSKKLAASLYEIGRLDGQLDRARKRIDALYAEHRAAVQQHLRTFPLSTTAKAKLLAIVEAGEGICCFEGMQRLKDIVDPIWAQVLNSWAYVRLGCSSGNDRWRVEYVAKLRRALDEGTFEMSE